MKNAIRRMTAPTEPPAAPAMRFMPGPLLCVGLEGPEGELALALPPLVVLGVSVGTVLAVDDGLVLDVVPFELDCMLLVP
jgi:hypothetical protein